MRLEGCDVGGTRFCARCRSTAPWRRSDTRCLANNMMQHAQGLDALGSTGLIAGLCVPCGSPFRLVVGRKRAQDGPHALVNQSAIATLHGGAKVSAFAERTRKNLLQIEKGIHQ
jgi:hypothetical protein